MFGTIARYVPIYTSGCGFIFCSSRSGVLGDVLLCSAELLKSGTSEGKSRSTSTVECVVQTPDRAQTERLLLYAGDLASEAAKQQLDWN